jgi:hypothetical protein
MLTMIYRKLIENVLEQLSDSLDMLSEAEYANPCRSLGNASIGQHVRHVIELFGCLYNGYEYGEVDYENRKRDIRIEKDKVLAIDLIGMICKHIDKPAKELLLRLNYDEHSSEGFTVSSNYHRELIYNLEHAVHHMALIRIGINEVSSVELPEGFGVATSTIKYRRSCAQ